MEKIHGPSRNAFTNVAFINGVPVAGRPQAQVTDKAKRDATKAMVEMARKGAANEAQAYKVAQAFAKAGVPANDTPEAKKAASKFAGQFAKAASGPQAAYVKNALAVVAGNDPDQAVQKSALVLGSMVRVAPIAARRDLAAGVDQLTNQADLNARKGAIQTERDSLAELQGFNSAANNLAAMKGLDVANIKTLDRSDDLSLDSQKDAAARNHRNRVIAMIPQRAPMQSASNADLAQAEAAASLASTSPEPGNIAPAVDLGAARAARDAANSAREQAEEAVVAAAQPEPSPEVKALADSTTVILAAAVAAPVVAELAVEAVAAPIMGLSLSLVPAAPVV